MIPVSSFQATKAATKTPTRGNHSISSVPQPTFRHPELVSG
jgi:hypothetical protein